jgi:uncharacterized small protein (DUF1192 family)
MTEAKFLIEIDARIAAIRETMQRLGDQASSTADAAGKVRLTDEISGLQQQLATLQNERDALS